MYKVILKTFLIGILILFTNCSENKPVQLINSWRVGTSSGLFTDFSQKEFNEFKRNGIDYIELSSGVFKDKTQGEKKAFVSDIKKKADKAGIKIWSIHLPFSSVYDISTPNDEDRNIMIRECSDLMLLFKPLKPQKYVIHASSPSPGWDSVPISEEERAKRLAISIESLKILSREVKKYNARLAVECLKSTRLGNRADELIMIVNAVDNGLEICFDSNHLFQEKPEEFVAKTGKLITTVHLSDYDGLAERHWLPGTGIINWNEVISALVNIGYKGPFMFETSTKKTSSTLTSNPEKLTSEELVSCYQEHKNNYVKSISGLK